MRFHQKVSRTGYGTAFVGLRNPIVHFALATGFLALQPAMKGNTAIAPATVGNGAITPAGRIMPKIAVPSSTRSARKASRVHGPTKVYRRGPSSTATSSPTTSTCKMSILSASLVSVGVGAALALGSSNAQGDSSAGEQSSGNDGDGGESSGESGLGEDSHPPGDNPNDPSEAGNGAAVDSNTGYRRDGGGSPPPPPPPPPSGTGVDDDNSGPIPPVFTPITLLVLLSYLLCKRELDNRRKKEFEGDISASSTSDARNIDSSLDTSSFGVDLGNVSLIVDVQPSLDVFEDVGGNKSVHFASSEIAPLLEIALSAIPPPDTVEFWDAGTVQKGPVSVQVYEPMPTSPNVLPLPEIKTCSADDKPSPKTVSAPLCIVDAIYMLFMIVFCGIVVYILGYITFSGFGNDAAPEDMDEVEFSRFRPIYDPQEVHVTFKPAELHLDFPDHCPKPDFYLFSHLLSQSFFGSILGFFMLPEPQPEFVFLPPDHRLVVPPLDEPAAFIEDVDEADNIDDLLALVLFQRPLVFFEEPVAFLEEVDEPLGLVVFQRPLVVDEHPVVVPQEPVAFVGEVNDVVNEPLPFVVLEPVPAVRDRPDFVEDEPLNVNAPPRGLNPLAPAFVPAARRTLKSSAPEVSSIPVFEAIQRGRRRPRSGRIPRHRAAFACG